MLKIKYLYKYQIYNYVNLTKLKNVALASNWNNFKQKN